MPVLYHLLLSILLGFLAVWLASATPGLFEFLKQRSSEVRVSYPVATGAWFFGLLLPLWAAFGFVSLQVLV